MGVWGWYAVGGTVCAVAYLLRGVLSPGAVRAHAERTAQTVGVTVCTSLMLLTLLVGIAWPVPLAGLVISGVAKAVRFLTVHGGEADA